MNNAVGYAQEHPHTGKGIFCTNLVTIIGTFVICSTVIGHFRWKIIIFSSIQYTKRCIEMK